ncbi:expressed unknown protein [Seminavis robusta]|uniref:ZZ-type domain-containing protein n=1 Tax=Seminavis robusta TaxID=568900 RepID=A0A9N8HZC3_9STRA|nr:expressed unknown protein [Seminavis robusta]|eukprot:Sro2232_g320080.1 n/a (410) ;mRNA; f:4641-5870
MNQDLFKGALDVVLQSGFVVRVSIETITVSDEEPRKITTTFFCCIDATGGDIRKLLRERLLETNLNSVELRLKERDGGPVIGRFDKSPLGAHLTCQIYPIPAAWQRLFDLVGIGSETERDRMREKMMMPRKCKQCPGNHALVESSSEEEMEGMVCDKCRGVLAGNNSTWFGCRDCNFDLCSVCHQGDQGSDHIMMASSCDPYEELETVAKHLAKKFAEFPCCPCLRDMSRDVHTVYWDHTHWGWVIPRTFRPFISFPDVYFVRLSWMQNVIAPGVRLVIRLGDELRRVVSEAVASQERCAKKIRTDSEHQSLLPGETDEILPNGANSRDIRDYGRQLLTHMDVWDAVEEQLERKVAAAMEGTGEVGRRFDRDVRLQLESFECEKVVYKLSAVAVAVAEGRPLPMPFASI